MKEGLPGLLLNNNFNSANVSIGMSMLSFGVSLQGGVRKTGNT